MRHGPGHRLRYRHRRSRTGSGRGRYDRRVTIKQHHDPENLFRANHNIAAAG
ncbi:BBE domain-containing protein [Kineosporia sp. NBRC 101731]|uniref:BBE domain-containing protein n=1 Tax=Kineosporia sp. NBRC 101731 TaxID=3032199 RepID=UPI0033318E37